VNKIFKRELFLKFCYNFKKNFYNRKEKIILTNKNCDNTTIKDCCKRTSKLFSYNSKKNSIENTRDKRIYYICDKKRYIAKNCLKF